jgi:2-polyprenyl-6-methoxyphenol hydroxylase-like FAD-dependent oxidoreductase
MNAIENKKIAIVGGGPGGLTLARLLQMSGADVTVYERDANKDARAKGATLDLHDDSGLKAIREAGLIEEFKANYRPGADRLSIMDKNAKLIMEHNVSEEHETFREDAWFRPEIDRGPLQQILLDSLHPGTIIWDRHFTSMTPDNGSWKLKFKNGDYVFADIVIAADGSRSKIRPYITPIRPFYTGVIALEGAIYNSGTTSPKIHKLLGGGKIFAMGDEKTLIVSSKGDGSLVFYVSFKKDENWGRECGIDFSDKAQVLAWFKEEFIGWDNIWQELFENVSADFILRPQYCMPLDQTWKALPNLTMLGDAAHLMPPYAGEGVNMAMLDALELSKCLISKDFPDTQSAIALYEKEMRIRAAEAATVTLESTAALHSKDAISYMIAIIS